tara:strand:+ start:21673 stop:23004 length:1332 start_codon:yes stop_codon:yes gene_type:complete
MPTNPFFMRAQCIFAVTIIALSGVTFTTAAKPLKNSVYYEGNGGCHPPRPSTYYPPLLIVQDHGEFDQAFIREPIQLDPSGFVTNEGKLEISQKYGQFYSETLFLRHFSTNCFSEVNRPGFTYFELPIIYVFEQPDGAIMTPPTVAHFLSYHMLNEAKVLTVLSNFAADLEIDPKGQVKKITPLKRWRSDKKVINRIFDKIKDSQGDRPLFKPATSNGKPVPCNVRLHWRIPEEDKEDFKRLSEAAINIKLKNEYSSLSLSVPEPLAFEASNEMSALVWNDGLGRVQGGYFMFESSGSRKLYKALGKQIWEWELLGYAPAYVSIYEFEYDPASRQLIVINIKYSDVHSAVPINTPRFRLPYVKAKGVFKMILTISEEGKVSNVEFLETPHKVLNKFVVKRMKDWLFAPATDQGRPIESYMNYEMPIDRAGPDLDALERAVRYR